MKRFLLVALVLLAMPLAAMAQPTPAEVQAFEAAVTQFQADYGTYQTQAATVATDQTAVNNAQLQLNTDTGTLNLTASSLATDIQNVIAAANALSNSTSAARAAKAKACPGCKAVAPGYTQDDVDYQIAITRGYGSEISIGKYAYVTRAVRQYLADQAAGVVDAKARFHAALDAERPAPNPQRKCNLATLAVAITPVMIEMMDPTMPPAQLAEIVYGLELVQAIACGTPPPTPIPTLTLPKAGVPTKAIRHATGLKLPPIEVRRKNHEAEARRHAIHHAKMAMRLATPLPATYDCRNLCTEIKDQGQCGNCWWHSTIETVESANIKVNNLTTAGALSQQFELDSCNVFSNGGCGGDDASNAFTWLQGGGGIPLQSVYGPYTAYSQSCQLTGTATGYTISDFGYCSTNPGVASTDLIKAAMLQYGPISVCIAADGALENFSGGSVFADTGYASINHQIVLAGWDDTKQAWLLRNSWGTGWADAGYCWIQYGANQVGTEAMYVVAGTPVVIQPGTQPPPTPPTRRAVSALNRGVELFNSGNPDDKAKALRAVKAAEDVLGIAN